MFTGHIIAQASGNARLGVEAETPIASGIAACLETLKPERLFGSLAAGSDILVVEAAMAKRIPFEIVLPARIDTFIAISVLPAGETWLERFRACLASASAVRYLTQDADHAPEDDDFAQAARAAMGFALIAGGAKAAQLAIWDGSMPSGIAGTAADVAAWQAKDRATWHVDPKGGFRRITRHPAGKTAPALSQNPRPQTTQADNLRSVTISGVTQFVRPMETPSLPDSVPTGIYARALAAALAVFANPAITAHPMTQARDLYHLDLPNPPE